MNNKLKITILITIGLATFLISSQSLSAQVLEGQAVADLREQENAFLQQVGLGRDISLGQIVSYIIQIFLAFLGVIFIVLIIYAGFMWMTSAGNEEKIAKAKTTMAAAIIGLAIVLAAYLITYFVIDKLLEATKGGVGLD